MKPLPREVPTQPLPKGIPPKEPKKPEGGWIFRIIFFGLALLMLIILFQR